MGHKNPPNPPTPALAKAGAAPGTTGGVEPDLSRPWPSHSSNITLRQAFPRQLLQLPAGLSKATLAATRPSHLFLRDSRLPFARPNPSKPSNPSAALSKATLAASRKPFQGNSRSYRPQTMLQTLPQAFPRQLSQLQAPSHLFLRAFKTAVCPPSNPSNPPAGLSKTTLAASRKPFQGNSRSYKPQTLLQTLPQAFPRQLSQLHAPAICFLRGLPALKSLKTFKPFRMPFQGNSCSFPQAFPRQLSQLQAPANASNPSANLSKATLAASRRPFQGNSRSYSPRHC